MRTKIEKLCDEIINDLRLDKDVSKKILLIKKIANEEVKMFEECLREMIGIAECLESDFSEKNNKNAQMFESGVSCAYKEAIRLVEEML